jgi:MYXO-CTERM domain-containing protein
VTPHGTPPKIIIEYTGAGAISEPPGLALFGFGLLGLRRRRN